MHSAQSPSADLLSPPVNGALALEQKQEIHDLRISVAFDSGRSRPLPRLKPVILRAAAAARVDQNPSAFSPPLVAHLPPLTQARVADPSNDTTFEVLVPEDRIRFLEYSHVCIDIPDMPSGGEAGQNATIQLRYTAEYMDPNHEHKRHLPVNETFYSCADVTLVSQSAFTYDDIPCFNATADWDDDTTGHHVQEHEHEHEHDHGSDHDHEHDHGSDESSDDDSGDSSSGGSGLSGGDIAGIVIGSVVGVAVIATAAWYFIRRDRREKQLAQHMTANANKSGAQSMSQSTS